MTAWLWAAVVIALILSFWAGMRVERKRRELHDGMDAELDAIDRDREVGGESEGRGACDEIGD